MSSDLDQMATDSEQMLDVAVQMTTHTDQMMTCRTFRGFADYAAAGTYSQGGDFGGYVAATFGCSGDACGVLGISGLGMQMEYELWQASRKPRPKILPFREAA